jgi:hypothetical protein
MMRPAFATARVIVASWSKDMGGAPRDHGGSFSIDWRDIVCAGTMKSFYETEGHACALQLAADSICDGIATAVVHYLRWDGQKREQELERVGGLILAPAARPSSSTRPYTSCGVFSEVTGRFWRKAAVRTNVRYWVNSGRHMLRWRFSAFDPKATSPSERPYHRGA